MLKGNHRVFDLPTGKKKNFFNSTTASAVHILPRNYNRWIIVIDPRLTFSSTTNQALNQKRIPMNFPWINCRLRFSLMRRSNRLNGNNSGQLMTVQYCSRHRVTVCDPLKRTKTRREFHHALFLLYHRATTIQNDCFDHFWVIATFVLNFQDDLQIDGCEKIKI